MLGGATSAPTIPVPALAAGAALAPGCLCSGRSGSGCLGPVGRGLRSGCLGLGSGPRGGPGGFPGAEFESRERRRGRDARSGLPALDRDALQRQVTPSTDVEDAEPLDVGGPDDLAVVTRQRDRLGDHRKPVAVVAAGQFVRAVPGQGEHAAVVLVGVHDRLDQLVGVAGHLVGPVLVAGGVLAASALAAGVVTGRLLLAAALGCRPASLTFCRAFDCASVRPDVPDRSSRAATPPSAARPTTPVRPATPAVSHSFRRRSPGGAAGGGAGGGPP